MGDNGKDKNVVDFEAVRQRRLELALESEGFQHESRSGERISPREANQESRQSSHPGRASLTTSFQDQVIKVELPFRQVKYVAASQEGDSEPFQLVLPVGGRGLEPKDLA